jgi:hypothetical protein
MQDTQRRGLLEVSMVTRLPVIGSRMVMGGLPRSDTGAMPCLRVRSGSFVIVVTGQLLHWTLTSPKQTEALLLGNGLDRLKKLFRHHDPVAVVDPIQRQLPLLNKPESDVDRDAASADLIVGPARSSDVQDLGELPLGQAQSMAQMAEPPPDSNIAAGI